jgi:hypothetical protein
MYGLGQPGKGPQWEWLRREIATRVQERRANALAGAKANTSNRKHEKNEQRVCEAVAVLNWDEFHGGTYDELFEAAGVSHITDRYKNSKDPKPAARAPKRWVKSILPPEIQARLSRRGRRKKI